MAQYEKIATQYVTAKHSSNAVEDIEYYTFVNHLLLPALGAKDMESNNLKSVLGEYRVLDLACGGGYVTSKRQQLER
jgi:2-polyprenyl-3-methyl-5-hydroxy-6-metoxy-1,4-benzoquinol methylase